MQVTLTQEEQGAINHSLRMYADIANADAPEGTEMYVHPKAKDALVAKALTEYVEDLMIELQGCSSPEETTVLMAKAIQAQTKAYIIHSLPVYLFQLGGMYEFVGEMNTAKDVFGQFLRAQSEFKPDEVDESFIAQAGFDMEHAIEVAYQKIEIAPSTNSALLPIGANRVGMQVDEDKALEVSTRVMEFCQQQLGKPTESQEIVFMWNLPDGNVVLQVGQAGNTHTINLFSTSRTVGSFSLRQ